MKQFLQGVLSEFINNVELVLSHNYSLADSDIPDMIDMVQSCAVMYDNLKPYLADKYKGKALGIEQGLMVLIEEIMPIAVILYSKDIKIDKADEREIIKIYERVSRIYRQAFLENKK